MGKRRARAVNHNQPFSRVLHLLFQRDQLLSVDKLAKLVAREYAKDAVISEITRQQMMQG